MPTYYDVLQVERTASPDRIRHAYRKLAQKYHPDKMPGNANAARAMAAINAAYGVLSDAQQRGEHDRWIERSARPAVQRVRPAPPTFWQAMNPVAGWPWYLLFGTTALALATIGTAVYLTTMPARAAAPKVQVQPRQAEPVEVAARTMG